MASCGMLISEQERRDRLVDHHMRDNLYVSPTKSKIQLRILWDRIWLGIW